ncbi:MAG: DinB family protein [Gemmatimonadota bacterium]|nr:DinB family protein [Gemmatimonadota bacterium]MDH3421834.1 DinB family protein [Gemmatimonadota bacterium]
MSSRAKALASRILQGADALATYADQLDEDQWATAIPVDGRSVGVVVHHVASVYPIEVQLAQTLASGNPITGVTWSGIADMNAQHAMDHADVGKAETVQLLRDNAAVAAAEVGRLSDAELDTAAPVSLNGDAPLTAQFFIEDHALRHSFHHLAKIRDALAS